MQSVTSSHHGILLSLRKKDTLAYVVAYEDIMLCELSQSQKCKYCVVELLRTVKVIAAEDRPVNVGIEERGDVEYLLGMKFQWYKIIKKCRDGYVFRAEHSGCMCSGNNKNYRIRGHEFERDGGIGGNGGRRGRERLCEYCGHI